MYFDWIRKKNFHNVVLLVNSIGLFILFWTIINYRNILWQFTIKDLNRQNTIDELKQEINSLQNALTENKKKFLELEFFSKNKRKYEIGNTKHGIYFAGNDEHYLYYDLNVERADGSVDDFSTSTYINFNSWDIIESFKVEIVGLINERDPIYKIIIQTRDRYTEGIVFPNSYSDGIVSYSRLYEIKNDYLDYRVSISPKEGGYKVVVKVGPEDTRQEQFIYGININGKDIEIEKPEI